MGDRPLLRLWLLTLGLYSGVRVSLWWRLCCWLLDLYCGKSATVESWTTDTLVSILGSQPVEIWLLTLGSLFWKKLDIRSSQTANKNLSNRYQEPVRVRYQKPVKQLDSKLYQEPLTQWDVKNQSVSNSQTWRIDLSVTVLLSEKLHTGVGPGRVPLLFRLHKPCPGKENRTSR